MSSSSHPSQIILHLLFKSLAILLYLFGSTLTSNFVFLFVVIILLQSADFYATKNIVGRKLAKLRWWATVDETTGKSNWRYESLDETDAKTSINTTDANFFWMVLYIYPLFWILFLVLGVLRFKFEWVVLDCVGAALSVGNLIGYSRCDKEKKRRWKEFGRQVGVGGEGDGGWNMSSVGGNVFGEGARNAFANAMFVNSVASTLNGNGNGDGDDRL